MRRPRTRPSGDLEVTNGYIAPLGGVVKAGGERGRLPCAPQVGPERTLQPDRIILNKENDCMRHYDRAELRHLNDSERYRDFEYVAVDGWADRAEPLETSTTTSARSTIEQAPPAPASPAPERAAPGSEPQPHPWRSFIGAIFSPRRTARRLFASLR